jgi:hypothetical protein
MVTTAAAVALVVSGVATPAYAAKTIMASGQPNCPSGQIATSVSLTLSNVGPSQQITVQTTVRAITKSPDSMMSGTATYNVALDGRYQNATASVFSTWNGTFTLAGATCKTAQAATVAVTSSQPGVPMTLIVTVSNPNDIMVTYQVSIPGHPAQTLNILAHHLQEVDFRPVDCGTTYRVSVVGDDGTNSSGTGTTVACPPAPTPPVIPPSQVQLSPSPQHSTATASASASASASTDITDIPDVLDSPSATPLVVAHTPSGGHGGRGLFRLVNIVMGIIILMMVAAFGAIVWLIYSTRRAVDDES